MWEVVVLSRGKFPKKEEAGQMVSPALSYNTDGRPWIFGGRRIGVLECLAHPHWLYKHTPGFPNESGRRSKTDFQAGPGGRGLCTPEGAIQDSGSPASPSPGASSWEGQDS